MSSEKLDYWGAELVTIDTTSSTGKDYKIEFPDGTIKWQVINTTTSTDVKDVALIGHTAASASAVAGGSSAAPVILFPLRYLGSDANSAFFEQAAFNTQSGQPLFVSGKEAKAGSATTDVVLSIQWVRQYQNPRQNGDAGSLTITES